MPYEILNKKFRIAQKTLDREFNQIQNATSEIERGLTQGNTAGEITKLLGGVVERLQVLKRKADESIGEELAAGYDCKRRLDHLRVKIFPPNEADGVTVDDYKKATINQWNKVRLDRMIVEHFLRLGYYESAEMLANRSNIRELTNLGNIILYKLK